MVLALIFNLMILSLGITGIRLNKKESVAKLFTYYTVDSNILALISTVLTVICILTKQTPLSPFLTFLRLTSAASLMLTLLVVIFFLPPSVPGGLKTLLFHGSMLYQHLLCPVLVIISWIFIDPIGKLSPWMIFASTVFTLVYGITVMILNGLRKVEGPYFFMRVHRQSPAKTAMWIAVIFSIILANSFVLYLLAGLRV